MKKIKNTTSLLENFLPTIPIGRKSDKAGSFKGGVNSPFSGIWGDKLKII